MKKCKVKMVVLHYIHFHLHITIKSFIKVMIYLDMYFHIQLWLKLSPNLTMLCH